MTRKFVTCPKHLFQFTRDATTPITIVSERIFFSSTDKAPEQTSDRKTHPPRPPYRGKRVARLSGSYLHKGSCTTVNFSPQFASLKGDRVNAPPQTLSQRSLYTEKDKGHGPSFYEGNFPKLIITY